MLYIKRATIILLVVLLAIPTLEARRKRAKAGDIEDNMYTDATHGFSMKLPEGWKVKIHDKDENFRITLVQKDYERPPEYSETPDFTLVPRMTLFVGETKMSSFMFMDSLVSETYESEQKDEIVREFEILNRQMFGGSIEREDVITTDRRAITINDQRAVTWQGKVQYVSYVPLIPSQPAEGTKSVHGEYRGGVFAVKLNDANILLFHVISEGQYFANIWAEAEEIMQSLTWDTEEG